MLNYEEIREMPLSELLMYYKALKEICEHYEKQMKPLYNANLPQDKNRWVAFNNELQHAQLYFDTVKSAMQYKVYNGLENYKKPEKSTKKPKPKKPIVKVSRTPKKSKSGKNVEVVN